MTEPIDAHSEEQALLPDLAQIAIGAGRKILEIYAQDFSVEHKEDNSPLTLADRRSHDFIVGSLKRLRFGRGEPLPILSEEGKDIPYAERRGWARYWLVDPLDGTKEFVKRNGEFTINIALMEDGAPLLGIMHIPVLDLMYFGTQSTGSFRLSAATDVLGPRPEADELSVEGLLAAAQKLPTEPPRGANEVVLVGSRSHRSPRVDEYVHALETEGKTVSTVSRGSALKFCLVAEGSADLYPRFGPTMEWDTAAGHAICSCVGKQVLEYATRKPLRYNKENLVNPEFIVC